jgi:hypothetical protein
VESCLLLGIKTEVAGAYQRRGRSGALMDLAQVDEAQNIPTARKVGANRFGEGVSRGLESVTAPSAPRR